MAECPGKLGVGDGTRQVPHELLERANPLGRHGLERESLDVAEGPDRHPAQRSQVGAAAEPHPEIGRQHTHISARRAFDENPVAVGLAGFEDLETEHLDAPGRSRHLDPLAGELVQSAPADLDSRDHGRNLLNPTGQRARRLSDLRHSDAAHVEVPGHLSRGIEGRGGHSEHDLADVCLR